MDGRATTDAGTGAGDQDDLPLQTGHVSSLSSFEHSRVLEGTAARFGYKLELLEPVWVEIFQSRASLFVSFDLRECDTCATKS